MKKLGLSIVLGSGLMFQTVSADALKNVLSKKLHSTQDEIPGMVNLDALGTMPPVKPKSRPVKAVVATVNGEKIIKKDADAYLSKRTKGKVKDYDLLPKEQRLALIKELSLPLIVAAQAQKELPQEEKDAILSRAWMQKKMADVKVSDAELEDAYAKIKAQAKVQNALQKVPPFEALKERLKMQIAERKVISDLMQGAQVRVAEDVGDIAGYVGMMAISVEDVNKALKAMTKSKATWETLPPQDKPRVLQMVAPGMLVALAAKNDFSKKQQESILSNYWMQKSLSQISVTDDEAKKRYEKIKTLNKKKKSTKKLPDFETLKRDLKMQIANERFMKGLMKQAKIKLK